jgi:hypothetical protein
MRWAARIQKSTDCRSVRKPQILAIRATVVCLKCAILSKANGYRYSLLICRLVRHFEGSFGDSYKKTAHKHLISGNRHPNL